MSEPIENEQPQPQPELAPPSELDYLKDLARQHGKPAAMAVGLVALAVAAAFFLRHRARVRAEESVEMLSAARTTKDLEELARDNRSSPIGPLAVLKLAKQHYDAGNYAAALDQYGQFRAKYPAHAMAAVAELGEIQCREAKGQASEAMSAYIAFSGAHPGHYLVPQAILGHARCLEQMERYDEARDLYGRFAEEYEDSGWSGLAEEMKSLVERRIERKEHPRPASSAVAPAWSNAAPAAIPVPTLDLTQP